MKLSRQTFYFLFLATFGLSLSVLFVFSGFFSRAAVTLGALCLAYMLLKKWEEKMKQAVASLVAEKAAATQAEEIRQTYENRLVTMRLELDTKLEEMRQAYHVFEDLQKEHQLILEQMKKNALDAAALEKYHEAKARDFVHTIKEQRLIIEKKQRQVTKLESKVSDLTYEIRSLLQLEEVVAPVKAPEFSVKKTFSKQGSSALTGYDATLLLQKFKEKAEKFKGVEHLGNRRFSNLPLDNYAIDERRFFDSFRLEAAGIVFVYSLMENKALFFNEHTHTLLGWAPEKMVKDFEGLVVKGYSKWREALEEKEGWADLTIATKEGQKKAFHCFFTSIATGPFAHQIIGILTTAEK